MVVIRNDLVGFFLLRYTDRSRDSFRVYLEMLLEMVEWVWVFVILESI